MDAVQFNKQLDAQLLDTGAVSSDLWRQLAEAHGYGAATSVAWVESKLAVLARRIGMGNTVTLHVPGAVEPQACSSVQELQAWASSQFPGVRVAGAELAT